MSSCVLRKSAPNIGWTTSATTNVHWKDLRRDLKHRLRMTSPWTRRCWPSAVCSERTDGRRVPDVTFSWTDRGMRDTAAPVSTRKLKGCLSMRIATENVDGLPIVATSESLVSFPEPLVKRPVMRYENQGLCKVACWATDTTGDIF